MGLRPTRPGLICDWLAENSEQLPGELAFALLNDKLEIAHSFTWRELNQSVQALAGKLAACLAPGERVLLLYPQGVEFVLAFCACLRAGLVPMTAPPYEQAHARRALPRINSILSSSGARALLCAQPIYEGREEALAHAPTLADCAWLSIEALLGNPEDGALPVPDADAVAYLQYTSGSTSEPKGSILGYDQIQTYFACHEQRIPLSAGDAIVTWLPHFHDYCLIAAILQAIYYRVPCYRMSALSFLARPHRWLQAVTRYHGTFIHAPNFAYELCARKITDAQCEGLDLSCLRQVECGAEPIRASTVTAFMERFRPYGLAPDLFRPSYGMAETVLIVSAPLKGEPCRVRSLSRAALSRGEAAPAEPGAHAAQVVGCGRPLDGLDLAIVDPVERRALPPGRVGEVWIRSGAVARGYYANPEATQESFNVCLAAPAPGLPEGPYFRTGDLGFLDEDRVLYLTGRRKDVIIVDGVNHYPADIEYSVESCHPDIMLSGVAAFSHDDGQTERLVIWAEVTATNDVEGMVRAILRAVSERHELEVFCIQLLRRGTVFKTSSGKVQHSACREAFAQGAVTPLHEWRRREEAPAESSSRTQPQIEEHLCRILAARLSLAPESIDVREPVASYGLSSRQAVALVVEMEEAFGGSLPLTLFWRFPSIRAVAAFLAQQGEDAAPGPVVEAPRSHGRIAVIGMGARFPGAATPEEFWRLLERGEDATGDVPASRWDVDGLYDPEPGTKGKTYVRRGGFLREVDRFDAAFFGLSGREAVQMDPQQRLLMEVTWEALEDAHLPADRLAGTDAGVYIGASHMDYGRLLMDDLEQIDIHTGAGVTLSIIANRISYWLGLHGPSMTIDTACSSAMVAIHQACQALRNRECSFAIAGGVSLILAPGATIALSQAHMLSPDGRCKAFADTADGYGRGEGCGVILIKRLEDALADGDPIIGVIEGTALAQDGRSNGLTAPSEVGQALVIRRALADARLSPAEVGFIEAHGTGTALGDPIEVAALKEVFGGARPADAPLWLGSVKSNIGHLEAAAGIAGVLKVLLAFRHRCLPATLHVERRNPALPLDGTPLRIATQAVALPEDGPCYAGVSSFGFGGALGHVILSAPPSGAQPPAAPPAAPLPLLLSARDPAALRDLARRYRDFLIATEHPLAAVCAAAATARVPFDHRLAITGATREEILARLEAYLSERAGEGIVCGAISGNTLAEPLALPSAGEPVAAEALARAYVAGRTVDWRALCDGVPTRAVRLPHYPFQRKRYWLETASPRGGVAPELAESLLRRIREARDLLGAGEEELARLLGGPAPPPTEAEVKTYVPRWQPCSPALAPRPGAWLLLDDGSATAERVRAALADTGCRVAVCPLVPGEEGERLAEALAGALPQGVVNCWSLEAGPAEGAEYRPLLRFFRVVQTVAARGGRVPVWTLIGTTHPVSPEDLPRPECGAVWGCAQVALMEHPECWGGLVDVGREVSEAGARQLAALLATPDAHGLLALRGDRFWRQEVACGVLPESAPPPATDGAWLVTGAFGGIGLQVVRALVSRGVRHLWLTARGGARTPEARALVEELGAEGVDLHVCLADAGSDADMARVFAEIDASGLPVRGIFHAAGTSPAILFDEYGEEEIHRVADAKIRGALLLDAYARRHEVQVFCVFSSVAAVTGGLGMAAYAAANHFMDTLMWRRRREGLPGLSINWGPWGQVGMFSDEMWARIQKHGLQRVLPGPGVAALLRALGGESPQYIAVAGEVESFLTYCAQHERQSLGSAPSPARGERPAAGPAAGENTNPLRAELKALPLDRRRERLMQILRAEVGRILRLEGEPLDPTQGFFTIGMDSLTTMELRGRIQSLLGITLSASVLFGAPCVADLTGALLDLLADEAPSATAPATPANGSPQAGEEELDAIVAAIEASYEAL